MTFGLSWRSVREKDKAVNSGIPNDEKAVEVPKQAARAFAISAIRETFTSERPMMAIRKGLFANWESA